MSDYETILIEREGRVARVSFNRPDKLNSFNGTQRREFLRAAQEVNADNDIWVVILTGAGRAFGAGADLSDTSEPMPNGGEGVEDQLNAEYKPGVLAIHHARKPWIAAINGPCAGISYSFAMACDLVVMAESSFLYQPFLGIGLVPDGGATWLLPNLVGAKRAYELMAFGEKLTAEKAVDWGLANRILPDEGFAAHAMAYGQGVSKPVALSVALHKRGNGFFGIA
jgi:2-(1,2-epoxy-1,2-dihydrophenyl)acetyl-CoA isomerase